MSLNLFLNLSLQTDVYVFLFTDLLLITKAKKGDKFKVIKPVSQSYLHVDHYSGHVDVFRNRGRIEGGGCECTCNFSGGERCVVLLGPSLLWDL